MNKYIDDIIAEILNASSFILNLKDDLGNNTFDGYNFSELLTRHTVVKQLAFFWTNLPEIDYKVFTEKQLVDFESILSALVDNYKEIKSYTLDVKDFASTYTNIVKNYNTIYDDLIEHTFPFVTILFISKGYINNTIANVLDVVNKSKEDIEFKVKSANDWHNKIILQNDKAGTLVKSLEIALDNVSIVKYSGIFNQEARKNQRASNQWLFAIWILIITLIAFALYILKDDELTSSTHSLIEVISTRVIIISSLFVGLSLCIKNYNAQKHNQTINKHRQNALNTFETFVKSAKGDSQIEQAILLEVTRTIFGNQHTGFSTSDNDSDSNSRIVEIIKNISNVKQ